MFDAQQPSNGSKPLAFDPIGKCPAFVVNPQVARAALGKQHADEVEYAHLVKANTPVAPIHSGLDGGMNRVFLAQVGGTIPPARVPPGSQLSQPPENKGSFTSRLLGLFGWKSAPQTQVASADSATIERGAHSAATGSILAPKIKLAPPSYTLASANPDELDASGPPRNDLSGVRAPIAALQIPSWQHIAASVPVSMGPPEPAHSFESRWSGLQSIAPGLPFNDRWALNSQ